MSYEDKKHKFSEDNPQIYKNRLRFYSNNNIYEHESTDSSEVEYHNFSNISMQNHNFYEQNCNQNHSESFIIDVRPKKKTFLSSEEKQQFIQEYSKKLKTELCKNFQTTGTCKFGDKCSFAHGYHQLQGKQHLHSNYKTKPCQKYFYRGYCQYGVRCQYMHMEVLGKSECRDFVHKLYKDKNLYLPPIKLCCNPIKRFKALQKKVQFENKYFDKDQYQFKTFSKRLPIFVEICSQSKKKPEKQQLLINSPMFITQDQQNFTPSTIQQQTKFTFDQPFQSEKSYKTDQEESEFSSFFSAREQEQQEQCYQQLY